MFFEWKKNFMQAMKITSSKPHDLSCSAVICGSTKTSITNLFCKNGILKNFEKFQENNLRWSLF